jgi:hypothetical protein
MKNFGEPFTIQEHKDNRDIDVLVLNFKKQLSLELAEAFNHKGDYLALEKALLAEWQDHPHFKDFDYLVHEPLDLEKLWMALAAWKCLPNKPAERMLVLDKIKEVGPTDSGDRDFLAVECFEKYHLKNLSLLKKHWHNCFPGEEGQEYDKNLYYRKMTGLKSDRYFLDEAIDNLDIASLYLDLSNESDGRKRFAIFLNTAFEDGLINETSRAFIKEFFASFWKKTK